MRLSINEIKKIVDVSLSENTDEWQSNGSYHTYKNGIGIPYDIKNKKLDTTIWIANGPTMLEVKVSSQLIPLNTFYKFKIYYKIMKMLKTSKFDKLNSINHI